MKIKMPLWPLVCGFAAGFISYQLNTDNSKIWGIPSYLISWICIGAGAFLSAFFLVILLREKPLNTGIFVFTGMMLAIVASMVIGMFQDRDSHSLAGLELIIYALISLPLALAGAYTAKFIRKINQE